MQHPARWRQAAGGSQGLLQDRMHRGRRARDSCTQLALDIPTRHIKATCLPRGQVTAPTSQCTGTRKETTRTTTVPKAPLSSARTVQVGARQPAAPPHAALATATGRGRQVSPSGGETEGCRVLGCRVRGCCVLGRGVSGRPVLGFGVSGYDVLGYGVPRRGVLGRGVPRCGVLGYRILGRPVLGYRRVPS